jgi:hypothetical protein
MLTTITAPMPRQRRPRGERTDWDYLTTARNLLTLVQDHVAGGVAGTDAADQIGRRDIATDAVSEAAILRALGGSQLSEPARFARLLDAAAANLAAALDFQ